MARDRERRRETWEVRDGSRTGGWMSGLPGDYLLARI